MVGLSLVYVGCLGVMCGATLRIICFVTSWLRRTKVSLSWLIVVVGLALCWMYLMMCGWRIIWCLRLVVVYSGVVKAMYD